MVIKKVNICFLLVIFAIVHSEELPGLSPSPCTIEYTKWSLNSKIDFVDHDVDQLQLDLSKIPVPWISSPFSYDMTQLRLCMEECGPYVNVDIGLARDAFGVDKSQIKHIPELADYSYGIGSIGVDIGVNLSLGIFDLVRTSVSPYVGAYRCRQGIFVSGYRSVFDSLRCSKEFVNRFGCNSYPNLLWDAAKGGIVVGMDMGIIGFRADVFWMPYVSPDIFVLSIDTSAMSAYKDSPSTCGMGYKVTARLNINPFYVSVGYLWDSCQADILLPYVRHSGLKHARGLLIQYHSGGFLSVGCCF